MPCDNLSFHKVNPSMFSNATQRPAVGIFDYIVVVCTFWHCAKANKY